MPTPELQEFLQVLRKGDAQEVQELLNHLEPFLRRTIRTRLRDGRLQHVVDPADIFQSLLKDLLSQEHSPAPVAGDSAELVAYLAAAVRNKVITRARKESRHQGSLPDDWNPVGTEVSPERQIEDQDFRQTIRSRLSGINPVLFDLKAQGLTWPEIAERVGGNPDSLRRRLTRAVAAALAELSSRGGES